MADKKNTSAQVAIIMGSDSDLSVMKDAAEMLQYFEINFEMTIVSAHRTPKRLFDFASQAQERGVKVIIAGAGGAAHLPGMVAAISPLPVIGVPVRSTALQGQDSLLSIVQMPKGVPVATVAIDGAANAGILAAQILSTSNPEMLERIKSYKAGLEEMVLEKARKLEK